LLDMLPTSSFFEHTSKKQAPESRVIDLARTLSYS
jgi:hypothetical protein